MLYAPVKGPIVIWYPRIFDFIYVVLADDGAICIALHCEVGMLKSGGGTTDCPSVCCLDGLLCNPLCG